MVDGPLYVVKKTDVFMVKYANGIKEVFKQDNTATQNQPGQTNSNTNDNTSNYRGPKKTHSFAILSLVFALLGILSYGLLSAFAIVFANSALEKIKREPNLYKGEMLAKVSRGIAVATIVLLILILIFAFIVILGVI